jgi:HD-like signal output (HDOD) protein
MTTTVTGKELLFSRLDGLRQIPTIPAVLTPLLHYLRQPVEELNVQKVTNFLSQDKSLAAQCLQLANSPLFGRWQQVTSLRGAVVSLGFNRVSDIAMSCGMLQILPDQKSGLDPIVFWEHSLGCALICRHLARNINLDDPGSAYLAGLLHDLGIIVNLWLLPEEFRKTFELAKTEAIPLHEAEKKTLGFTHCDSGRLLAENWGFAPALADVIAHHHLPQESSSDAALVALVHIADLLCRMGGLNYGYVEEREVNLFQDAGFALLARSSAKMKKFDWARLTFELDSYMDEVHRLVRSIYRS